MSLLRSTSLTLTSCKSAGDECQSHLQGPVDVVGLQRSPSLVSLDLSTIVPVGDSLARVDGAPVDGEQRCRLGSSGRDFGNLSLDHSHRFPDRRTNSRPVCKPVRVK
ncbi:hypothetical protein WJX79_004785 [Trebouxia sp. C0005]